MTTLTAPAAPAANYFGVATAISCALAYVLHEDGYPDVVALSVEEGEATAYIDLTPEQAEHLGRLLIAKAAEARS